MRLVLRSEKVRAYRKVFLDAEGELTAPGKLVVSDLAAVAGIGRVRPNATGEELQFREGARSVLLHLFARLDPKALRTLARQMRETDDE